MAPEVKPEKKKESKERNKKVLVAQPETEQLRDRNKMALEENNGTVGFVSHFFSLIVCLSQEPTPFP